jgi:hypothetical protein
MVMIPLIPEHYVRVRVLKWRERRRNAPAVTQGSLWIRFKAWAVGFPRAVALSGATKETPPLGGQGRGQSLADSIGVWGAHAAKHSSNARRGNWFLPNIWGPPPGLFLLACRL